MKYLEPGHPTANMFGSTGLQRPRSSDQVEAATRCLEVCFTQRVKQLMPRLEAVHDVRE